MQSAEVQKESEPRGELTPSEAKSLASFRQASDNVLCEIGKLEVHKAQLIARLDQYEQAAQSVLSKVGERLGFSPGEAWFVAPDGTVRAGTP